MLVLAGLPASAATRPGETTHVSRALDGQPGDGISTASGVSADGRYVVFQSTARNLVPDGNGTIDIYVYDRSSGGIDQVTRAYDGGRPNSYSQLPAISGDGRYVSFYSRATNLTEQDMPSGVGRIFVHDRGTGATELVTRAPDGSPANASAQSHSLSGDGRYVAWATRATNLVAGVTDGELHCYLHDRETRQNVLVSQSSDGQPGNQPCWFAQVNHDGRYVSFDSRATNLVDGAGGLVFDVFVRDLQTGTTEWVSLTWDDRPPNASSRSATLSADGRYVAFRSDATNMTPVQDTTNPFPSDVFVRDRLEGTTERVSVSTAGEIGDLGSFVPYISANGRYVIFSSAATNFDGLTPPAPQDVFIHDRLLHRTERVSVGSNGQPGNGASSSSQISPEGRYAGFVSLATNFAPATDNGTVDVFLRDRGPDVGVVGVTAGPLGESVRVRGGAVFAGARISHAEADGVLVASSGVELDNAAVYYHPHERQLLFRAVVNGMHTLPTLRQHAPGVQYVFAFATPAGAHELRLTQRSGGIAAVPPQVSRTVAELYRCDGDCVLLGEVAGTVGTVGPVAMATVPLDFLALAEGEELTGIRAAVVVGDRGLAGLPTHELALPGAEIPQRSVRLALTMVGDTPEQEEFGPPVDLGDSRFDVQIDRPGDGSHTVWVRTCLGATCEVEPVGGG